MKKFFLTFVWVFVLSIMVFSQDIFSPISDLNDSEKSIIEEAKNKIDRGNRMAANADNDRQKYANLFDSDRRRRQNRAEKKLVPAKRNLLSAGNFHREGYEALYNLYYEKLSTLSFKFPADQQEADNLASQAERLYRNGTTALTRNAASYTDRELERDVKFNSLETSVKTGERQLKEAVEKLSEALILYEKQADKEQEYYAQDLEAWQNAMMQNSISGYEKYIEDFPLGKFINQAQSKIEELEERIRLAEQMQSNPNLAYHIQIMADTKSWTKEDIKSKIFFTNEEIVEKYVDGWYKYWIGSYNTYSEAKVRRDQVRRTRRGAFVVATINGEPVGEILKAIDVEEKK
jgi:hypothetical protein